MEDVNFVAFIGDLISTKLNPINFKTTCEASVVIVHLPNKMKCAKSHLQNLRPIKITMYRAMQCIYLFILRGLIKWHNSSTCL